MKRAVTIAEEYGQIGTILGLTSVFEGISSMHIAKIKNRVVSSTAFFNELWQIYAQLRVDPKERIGTARSGQRQLALIAITSEGGLIGDIDQRIVESMVANPELHHADLYVIGSHGGTLFAQAGIRPARVFTLPDVETGGDIRPIVNLVSQYQHTGVYYQTYVSLTKQTVARIDLFSAVAALGQSVAEDATPNVISSRDYTFEPSLGEIIEYLESTMLEIALGQVMLESKLAQYASRFNAMTAAKDRATEMRDDLGIALHRAKRGEADSRIKEILVAMKVGQR